MAANCSKRYWRHVNCNARDTNCTAAKRRKWDVHVYNETI